MDEGYLRLRHRGADPIFLFDLPRKGIFLFDPHLLIDKSYRELKSLFLQKFLLPIGRCCRFHRFGFQCSIFPPMEPNLLQYRHCRARQHLPVGGLRQIVLPPVLAADGSLVTFLLRQEKLRNPLKDRKSRSTCKQLRIFQSGNESLTMAGSSTAVFCFDAGMGIL